MTREQFLEIDKTIVWAKLTMSQQDFEEFCQVSNSNNPNGYFYSLQEKIDYYDMKEKFYEQINKTGNEISR